MNLDIIQGYPLILGDNVSSDVILHGRYSLLGDPEEMAKHVLEDLGPELSQKVKSCPIIVAGKNFGCGPGREATVVALKAAGVRAVLAKSFFRMFLRNAINQGIIPIEWEYPGDISKLHVPLEISVEKGLVKVEGQSSPFKRLPDKLMDILNEGGLVKYARKKLGGR